MLQTESCVLVEIVANGTKQLWRVAWKRYELLERNHSSRDVYSYDDEKALQTFFPLEMIIPSSIAQRMWMITCASVWQRQMFIPWTNPDHLWIRGKRDQVPSECKSKTNLHMHRLNNLTSKLLLVCARSLSDGNASPRGSVGIHGTQSVTELPRYWSSRVCIEELAHHHRP